jgi:NADH-quinone oxidoreductase subunit I
MGICRSFVDGIYNLLLGLKVTGGCLPQNAVTLQYPDERWEMPERSRGIVVLLSDKQTGKLNCTACLLCQKACPTGAITIERERGEDKKWFAKSFTVDNTICCFCGLCEEACNFAAIKMATKYEFSVYDQAELVFDIHRLQEIGRDVPYTPKPKKKPAAKKPVAAKPAKKVGEEPESKPAPKVESKAEDKTTADDASGDLFDGVEAKPQSNTGESVDDEPKKGDPGAGKAKAEE